MGGRGHDAPGQHLGAALVEKGGLFWKETSHFSDCVAMPSKARNWEWCNWQEKANLALSGSLSEYTIHNFARRLWPEVFSIAEILICYNAWPQKRLVLG